MFNNVIIIGSIIALLFLIIGRSGQLKTETLKRSCCRSNAVCLMTRSLAIILDSLLLTNATKDYLPI